MIYLYGAVDDAESALDALRDPCGETAGLHRGLGDITALRAARVVCLAESRPAAELAADGPALVHHDLVLRRAMAACTVIPFRFGTAVESDRDMDRLLDGCADRFEDLFARLRGRRELALRARVAGPEKPAPCERTGRAYLRRLASVSLPGPVKELHRTMADAAVDSVVEGDGAGGIKASYLVEDRQVDVFGELLASCQRRIGGIEVSLTGPWAPYSFVGSTHPGSDRKGATPAAVKGADDG